MNECGLATKEKWRSPCWDYCVFFFGYFSCHGGHIGLACMLLLLLVYETLVSVLHPDMGAIGGRKNTIAYPGMNCFVLQNSATCGVCVLFVVFGLVVFDVLAFQVPMRRCRNINELVSFF